jgi:signal transduction histidine kinase
LREVNYNLAHNAVEAMQTTANMNRVLQVRTQRRGADAVVTTVQDTEPGIDPKKIDGIFDVFVTTKATGMGLGLAISRMIVQHHGGQLTASSDGRSGTLFEIIVPIKCAEPPALEMDAAGSDEEPAAAR